jgi:IclR family mhp operon transcriptional activator
VRPYKIKTIRALERGLEVLAVLQSSRAASLHDLHLATGLPKATLTRIVVTLERHGLIWQRLADNAFVPTCMLLPRAPQIKDENHLVEVASPVLERLCRKVDWPSVLAVPRLTYLEVLETNRPKSYFSHIPVGPVGVHVDMLRSSIGRAYLAFCSEPERQAALQRLRASDPRDALSSRPTAVKRLLDQTRLAGYAQRYASFGGQYNWSRREFQDGRDSIAIPVIVSGDVIASVNLTWITKVETAENIVGAHLDALREAVQDIRQRLGDC